MKAARAGHIQTVQFLVAKGQPTPALAPRKGQKITVFSAGAEVNRRTSNNDHTVLSLASAGGHVSVVQYLLMRGAEPSHMLRVSLTGCDESLAS